MNMTCLGCRVHLGNKKIALQLTLEQGRGEGGRPPTQPKICM